MLIVSNVVIIAVILVAFLAATLLTACLLTYFLGAMSVGIVFGTWAIVIASIILFARLLSGLF